MFSVSIGGSGGLFLGCSVLSLTEIFYFFTIRLFIYILGIRRKKRDQTPPTKPETSTRKNVVHETAYL
jgi:hypothetical protein